jgi:hypothetical protein
MIYGAARVEGRYGKALHFDGLNDYVYIGNSSSLEFNQSITIACWVKVDGTTGEYQSFISQHWGSVSSYALEFWPDAKTPQFSVWTSASSHKYAVSNISLDFGQWTFLAGTFDGQKIKMYFNGTLTGIDDLVGLMEVKDYPFTIGAHVIDWDRNWFNGTIDNVLLYNRALNVEEIQALYTSPPF